MDFRNFTCGTPPLEKPMEPREPPKENTSGVLRLFVYGTLKRGYWNHDPFCGGASTRDRGSRFSRSQTKTSSPYGTADALADVATQARLSGRKVLISLGLGSKESGEAWLEFVRDLDRRGLPAPLFVTTDGAGGLIQTIDQMWPKSLRGRCWVHRMRNFAAKVPDARWHEIKPYLVMIRDAPDLQAGQSAVREFLEKFSKEFPGPPTMTTWDLSSKGIRRGQI